MRAIEVLAPAKINLTLEVLSKRRDGYHEIATVMQTIDLCDTVTLEDAAEISVEFQGEAAEGLPEDREQELAYQAATRMSRWLNEPRSVRISLHKRIPAGMGLGGGSSDAAAVIRGLNVLWGLNRESASLKRLAAEIGSDVAFFVYCGAALCRGRGEIVDPLPDGRAAHVTLFLPKERLADKTATMYGLLSRSDFTAGTTTRGVVDDIVMRGEVIDAKNVFDKHAGRFGERLPLAMDACSRAGFDVHLAGSGPAFFALRPKSELPARELALMEWMEIEVRECTTLGREASLRIREV